MFYKIADWKVNLDQPFDLIAKPNQCHWCDPREASVGACPANQPLEIPQLVLDPANPPSGAVYNTTFCVDGTNLVSGNPCWRLTGVRLPDAATGLIEAVPAQCAQSANATPSGRGIGFWKRGGDRFCSGSLPPSWPYYGNCPKEGASPPEDGRACGDADSLPPANWPDDIVDDLEYGLNDFSDWVRPILMPRAPTLWQALLKVGIRRRPNGSSGVLTRVPPTVPRARRAVPCAPRKTERYGYGMTISGK